MLASSIYVRKASESFLFLLLAFFIPLHKRLAVETLSVSKPHPQHFARRAHQDKKNAIGDAIARNSSPSDVLYSTETLHPEVEVVGVFVFGTSNTSANVAPLR